MNDPFAVAVLMLVAVATVCLWRLSEALRFLLHAWAFYLAFKKGPARVHGAPPRPVPQCRPRPHGSVDKPPRPPDRDPAPPSPPPPPPPRDVRGRP